MFCPNKNSFLQLHCAMNPKVINAAVSHAMRKKQIASSEDADTLSTPRLESLQPSLYGQFMNVTRTHLGFGRIGLGLILRQLHDENHLVQVQALHTAFDQVQIPENAMYLIERNIVDKLVHLMVHNDPLVREKVLLTLTVLANYAKGRQRILSRPRIVDRLILMVMQDRKEIRYAAAIFLKTVTRDRCACQVIMKNEEIVESLLKMIKHDHVGIVIFHINSLKYLSEWDPVPAMKLNAFKLLKEMMVYHQYRIVQAALECLTQFCKYEMGKKLADKYDMTKFLLPYLVSPDVEVIISAVGLMQFTTLTPKAKWRTREFAYDLVKRLVALCTAHNVPVLQLRAMQVLINLCDCASMREQIRFYYQNKISKKVAVRNHEQWDGTRETTTYGLQSCHNYTAMCTDDWETFKNEVGTDAVALDVQSYKKTIRSVKKQLLKAMKFQPHIH